MKDSSSRWSASFKTSFAVDKLIIHSSSNTTHADGFAFVMSADPSSLGGPGKYLGFYHYNKTAFF